MKVSFRDEEEIKTYPDVGKLNDFCCQAYSKMCMWQKDLE